jgi:3-oxoadipate enol-lactonase
MDFVQCTSGLHAYLERAPQARDPAGSARASMVFVHALGTDQRVWQPVVDLLPQGSRVIGYDLRGHGLSDVGSTPYSIEGLARDLDELCERLGLGPSIVCGLSVGGLVAQALALARPERVRALCLCGTGARIGNAELWRDRAEQVRRQGLAAIAPGVVERWFTPAFGERHPERVRGYRTLLERSAPEGYLATLAALAEGDLRDRVSRLSCPTLVVSGALDAATPPDLGRELSAAIAGSAFRLLPEAAHLMSVEQPRALADTLMGFLRERSLV